MQTEEPTEPNQTRQCSCYKFSRWEPAPFLPSPPASIPSNWLQTFANNFQPFEKATFKEGLAFPLSSLQMTMLKYTLVFYIKPQESQRNLNGLWNTGVKLFNHGQTCGSDVRKPSLGTGALLKTEAAANVMKAFGNSRQYMQRRRSHCLKPEKCLHLTYVFLSI